MEVVVTASPADKNIVVWDFKTGQVVATYTGNESASKNAWSLIGSDYMVTVQPPRKSLYVWSWKKPRPIIKCTLPESMEVISASNDGLYCVAGSVSGRLYLWHVTTGRLVCQWDAHFRKVNCIKWTNDDNYIVTAGDDALAYLWEVSSLFPSRGGAVPTPKPRSTWTDHGLSITSLFISSTSFHRPKLFTSSKDQTVKIYDLFGNSLMLSIQFPVAITNVILDSLETKLYVGGLDGSIFIVDLVGHSYGSDSKKIRLKLHDQEICDLSLSIDEKFLLSLDKAGLVKVWDIASHQVVQTYQKHKGAVTMCKVEWKQKGFNEQPVVKGKGKSSKKQNMTGFGSLQGNFLEKEKRNESEANVVYGDGAPIQPFQRVLWMDNLKDRDEVKIGLKVDGTGTEVDQAKMKRDEIEEGLKSLRRIVTKEDLAGEIDQLKNKVLSVEAENTKWKQTSKKLYDFCVETMVEDDKRTGAPADQNVWSVVSSRQKRKVQSSKRKNPKKARNRYLQ